MRGLGPGMRPGVERHPVSNEAWRWRYARLAEAVDSTRTRRSDGWRCSRTERCRGLMHPSALLSSDESEHAPLADVEACDGVALTTELATEPAIEPLMLCVRHVPSPTSCGAISEPSEPGELLGVPQESDRPCPRIVADSCLGGAADSSLQTTTSLSSSTAGASVSFGGADAAVDESAGSSVLMCALRRIRARPFRRVCRRAPSRRVGRRFEFHTHI